MKEKMKDKITHELALNYLDILENYVGSNNDELLELVKYVKQQEKQEELLELYRDFVKSLDVQIVSSQRILINVEDYELSNLQIKKIKQIKEIENDTN